MTNSFLDDCRREFQIRTGGVVQRDRQAASVSYRTAGSSSYDGQSQFGRNSPAALPPEWNSRKGEVVARQRSLAWSEQQRISSGRYFAQHRRIISGWTSRCTRRSGAAIRRGAGGSGKRSGLDSRLRSRTGSRVPLTQIWLGKHFASRFRLDWERGRLNDENLNRASKKTLRVWHATLRRARCRIPDYDLRSTYATHFRRVAWRIRVVTQLWQEDVQGVQEVLADETGGSAKAGQ